MNIGKIVQVVNSEDLKSEHLKVDENPVEWSVDWESDRVVVESVSGCVLQTAGLAGEPEAEFGVGGIKRTFANSAQD